MKGKLNMSTLLVLFHPNLSCLVTYVNSLIISHQASYDGLETHCLELCPSCVFYVTFSVTDVKVQP